LNFSETSSIKRDFSPEEFENVEFSDHADIYVINSCSVTGKAEKTCRALVRRALKTNPEAKVAIIGCFSQLKPAELAAMPGVALVLGNDEKFNLLEHLKNLSQPIKTAIDNKDPEKFVPTFSSDDRTRSFFKIQDGCDYFCTYCTIPLARGHSRSNTIVQTIESAIELAKTGIKEVVLSGVNIGDFGKDNSETFYEFLKQLVKVDGFERIRISSVEPDLLLDEIIELVAKEPKLMPHFHIPLQSGSNQVLKDMGRHYLREVFESRVIKIKELMPHACIAADVIVGFPTETDELFAETSKFIENLPISYLHVFSYSERENTRALKIQRRNSPQQIAQRSKVLHDLSEKKKVQFYAENKGYKALVLWENDRSGDYIHGFTDNYIRLKTKYDEKLVNTVQEITI
jgi:threonylcarbamoyladenosine tRNA methylthiotransferase MtaB